MLDEAEEQVAESEDNSSDAVQTRAGVTSEFDVFSKEYSTGIASSEKAKRGASNNSGWLFTDAEFEKIKTVVNHNDKK